MDIQFLPKSICSIKCHANEYFSRNDIWVTWPWIIKYSKYIIHWQKVWSTLQHFLVNFLQKVNTTFHLWIGHNQARHYCINNENCVLQEELVTFSSTDYQPKILNSFLLYFSEVRVKLYFIAQNKINWYLFLAFEWKINLIECLRSEYIANWIRDLKYGPCTIMLIFTKKASSWHKSTRRDRGYCHPFISWLGLCTNKWHYEISSSENIFPKLLSGFLSLK